MSVGGASEQRRKKLEKTFFGDDSRARRERLRLREEEALAQRALASASGINDPALLERLASMGIRAETLAALTLIPLIEVAWADGVMEEEERVAVLSGAASTGIAKDSPSYGLLRIWVEDRPPPETFRAWREFIKAVCGELAEEERGRLREKVVGRARAVAEAAGGILGRGASISPEKDALLSEIARTFEP